MAATQTPDPDVGTIAINDKRPSRRRPRDCPGGPAVSLPGLRHARAFWVADRGRGEIRTSMIAPTAENDVLIQAVVSGISRGTEVLVFRGDVPASQADTMACPFQEGTFPAPVKYGYALVAYVREGPRDLVNRNVFLLHPHQDYAYVPASTVVALPTGLPVERAVLAANMETALNGLWDANVRAGDKVCVLGAGVVGVLVAWLAVGLPATEVLLVDPDASKAPVAERLGLTHCSEPPLHAAFDVVIHASGNPEGLSAALALCDFEATILEMSWFGTKTVSLSLGEAFHSKRLTLRSSQVGSVASCQRSRWTRRRRLETALRLLRDDRLDSLLTGESPFEAMPAVMSSLAANTMPSVLCHVIRYGPPTGV